MQKMVTLRMEAKMQEALKRLADQRFCSVASLIKQAADKLLQENGIEWRKENTDITKD